MKAVNPAAAQVLYQGYSLMKLHTQTQYPEDGWFRRVLGRAVIVCASYMKCEPMYLSRARYKIEKMSTSLKQILDSLSPNKCYACYFL